MESINTTTASNISSSNTFDMFDNSNRNQINIAIVGAVSAGKSTLLNTIFAKTYSHCKIKRTTMTPQIYYEYDGKSPSKASKSIREENKAINDLLIKKTENQEQISIEDIKEAKYIVPKIYKFTKLVKDVFLSIYDIPGLNDARTKDLYFQYLENNFYKFDIILFVIDINSALNTSDEIDILTKIILNCKANYDKYGIHNKLLILANKCDEMSLNDKGQLLLEEELDEMLQQITTQVAQKVDEIYSDLEYHIQPLSSEDSYIYRILERNPESDLDMKYLNKFGYMEFGRTRWNKLSEEKKKLQIKKLMSDWDMDSTLTITGFKGFSNILNNYLTPENQKMFVNNHIIYEIHGITGNHKVDISDDIQRFYRYYLKYKELNGKISEGINLIEVFSKFMTSYLEGYKTKVLDGFISEDMSNSKNPQNQDIGLDLLVNKSKNVPMTYSNTVSFNSSKYKKKNGKNSNNSKHNTKLSHRRNAENHLSKTPVKTTMKAGNVRYSIKNESYIPQIDEAKKIIDNMTRLFNGDVPIIADLSNMVNNTLTQFYSQQIDGKSKPVATLFNYIKSLLGFNVYPSSNNIDNFFENPDMINSSPQTIIGYINDFESQDLLDIDTKLQKTLDIILKIYKNISIMPSDVEPDTNYMKRVDYPSYTYFVDKFWTKFIMFHDSYDTQVEALAFQAKVNCAKKLLNDNCVSYFNNDSKSMLVLENYYLDMYCENISRMMKSDSSSSDTDNPNEHNHTVSDDDDYHEINNVEDTAENNDYGLDDIGGDIDRALELNS